VARLGRHRGCGGPVRMYTQRTRAYTYQYPKCSTCHVHVHVTDIEPDTTNGGNKGGRPPAEKSSEIDSTRYHTNINVGKFRRRG